MRTLTRNSALGLVFLFAGILGSYSEIANSENQSSVLDEIRASGVLRVAAEPDTPPMLTSEGERYDGFDWQVSKAIARFIGVTNVVIVPGKYSELPGRLISGRADLIVSGYVSDEELTDIAWSDSYYDFGLCLVVRSDSDIRNVNDLAGKVVGIFNDPAAEEEVSRLVPYPERIEKFEDGYFDILSEGKIDGFIYDYPYAQEEIKAYGNKLRIVQFNLTKSAYSVGVRAGDPQLLTAVNSAISTLKNSPAYGVFVRRYLGGSGPTKVEPGRIDSNQRIYTVKPGDSLSRIAISQLGSVNRWSSIWELNRNRIADPNLITVGWELLLPKK